eukprot:1978425-Rhodomonas_salina.2
MGIAGTSVHVVQVTPSPTITLRIYRALFDSDSDRAHRDVGRRRPTSLRQRACSWAWTGPTRSKSAQTTSLASTPGLATWISRRHALSSRDFPTLTWHCDRGDGGVDVALGVV